MIDRMQFPTQTPLYYATNRDRYERQKLIKDIEAYTERKLIVYVANLNHPSSSITRDDILPFTDLCHDIQLNEPIDFMLHSPGGNPDAAEQLVNILLSRSKDIRVIIPQTAKSAATMIALVADVILMSDSSELGPIDPQITFNTPQGLQRRPAMALLKGLEDIQKEVVNNNGLNPVYFPILQGIDPALIHFCKQAEKHALSLATKWLLRSMCKGDPVRAESIAKQLLNIEQYPSHGQVINWEEAKRIGLKVEYLPLDDKTWEGFWRLFCYYDVQLKAKKRVKIFESSRVSVEM